MALTKIDDRGLKTPIDLQDNEKIRLGTGNDLELFHTGTHSYIQNSVGNLLIGNNYDGDVGGDIYIQAKYGENSITCFDDGGVELYYDNSNKFQTVSDGVRVTGHLHANDNYHIKLGNGNDLQLYHDGSHNYILSSNGHIHLVGDGTNQVKITAKNGEQGILITPNGSVELYYDNSKKFETTSSGIKGYGTGVGHIFLGDFRVKTEADANFVTFKPAESLVRWHDNHKAVFGASNDLQLYHDGTHSYIYNTTGELKNRAAIWKVVNAANSEIQIKATENAAVELYYDNVKKLETTTYGTRTTGYHTQSTAIGFQGDNADWTSSTRYMHNMHLHWNSGHFVNSTGVFTCPVAGKYLCSASVQAHRANNPSGSNGQYYNVIWQKNNSNYHTEMVGTVATDASALSTSAVNGKHETITATVIIDCAANDTIRAHSNHGYRNNSQNICSVYLLG